MERLELSLPADYVAALDRIARAEDVSRGQVIRDAIRRDLKRREKAKTPVRADERLVAPLRALLAEDFAYARDWSDLQSRLAAKGYRLQEAGGGLALHALDGRRLCKGSELGYGYALLVRKFGAPLPGHAHRAVAARALRPPAARAPECPAAAARSPIRR
jgi:Arc/MetJ-type ribon-helix-helix transcriptional regulator